jgi:hypothetical protein
MLRLYAGTCAKDFADPGANEDRMALSEDGFRVAVCDGASESFDSARWASVLAQRFLREPVLGPQWLAATREDYLASVEPSSLSWSQAAAYERGSFATLLAIERNAETATVSLTAIGDSAALLLDGGRLVGAWPHADPERFADRPTLLSTVEGAGFDEPRDWPPPVSLDLAGLCAPLLLCMTDALAEWALRSALAGDQGLTELAAIDADEALRELVQRERGAGRMRVDDCSLVTLALGA